MLSLHPATMAAPKFTKILLLSMFCTVSASDSTSKQVLPHITDCFSANMETFRCQWSSGSFHNLSEPGALRLFYMNKPSVADWLECPHYSTQRPDECFFNENHTTVWTNYRVELRSRDQSVVYDDSVFNVYDRVRPDPPYNVSWVPLNASLSGQYYDIMLRWSPPQSADVSSGWIRLQYEVQHRDTSSDVWKVSNLLDSTHCSVFGLHSNANYEVRVRCKMPGMRFSNFSDSVLVYNPSQVSRFPVAALLIFGALCLVAILMLVIISQQQKLMVLLLPPIPGPKIRGIDTELLKKGKLRELTSILGPSDLGAELYSSDPWVEFIELDLEEQHDELTHCLVPGSLCTDDSHEADCSAGFRDDDSGRASCCEPDLHSDTESSPLHPDAMEETQSQEASSLNTSPTPLNKEAMYTQVSEVRPSGNVVLSPEEDKVKDREAAKLKHKHIFVGDTSGYMSELNAGKVSSPETILASSALSPAPVYTVVEGVDPQNSLLLTPNFPHLVISKPTLEGYLTPDLFGSITP